MPNRREFLKNSAMAMTALAAGQWFNCQSEKSQPNFVVIFCDDLGYGDVGVFGHPTIRTPNIDRMASEGQKWSNFYVGASVCTPSRAALLTGRLPIRSGMCSDVRRVLFPDSAGGLPENEITIAEALKTKGYKTAAVGKWHLGHLPQYLPTNHGFDYYYGIPYSNDMDRIEGVDHYESCVDPEIDYFQVPLMENEEVIEKPANQKTITKRYTEKAVEFIQQNRDEPFFLYLAHTMPHVPLFRSENFEEKSRRGIYGDVIEELDWSVGQVLETLRRNNLDENTMVIFTSDNGPWAIFNELGGSAGLLRGEKGATFEGGMREPTIFWWPGKIKPGVVMGMGATMDLLPTVCNMAEVPLPDDRVYDGQDLTGVLFHEEESPRDTIFYYRGTRIYAVRKGSYKAHFITQPAFGEVLDETHHDPPLLYNLDYDPSEQYNIADKHPDIIKMLREEVEKHQKTVTLVEDQLAKRIQSDDFDYGEKSL